MFERCSLGPWFAEVIYAGNTSSCRPAPQSVIPVVYPSGHPLENTPINPWPVQICNNSGHAHDQRESHTTPALPTCPGQSLSASTRGQSFPTRTRVPVYIPDSARVTPGGTILQFVPHCRRLSTMVSHLTGANPEKSLLKLLID